MPRKLSEEQLLKQRMKRSKRSFTDFYDKRSAGKLLHALYVAINDLNRDQTLVDRKFLSHLRPTGCTSGLSDLEATYLVLVTPELSEELHRYDSSLIYSVLGISKIEKANRAIHSKDLGLAEKLTVEAEQIAIQLREEGAANKPLFWMKKENTVIDQKIQTSRARKQAVEASSRYKNAPIRKQLVENYTDNVKKLLVHFNRPTDSKSLLKFSIRALDRYTVSDTEIMQLAQLDRDLNQLIEDLCKEFSDGLGRDYLYKTIKNYLKI